MIFQAKFFQSLVIIFHIIDMVGMIEIQGFLTKNKQGAYFNDRRMI